jgi:hypothetical protein
MSACAEKQCFAAALRLILSWHAPAINGKEHGREVQRSFGKPPYATGFCGNRTAFRLMAEMSAISEMPPAVKNSGRKAAV